MDNFDKFPALMNKFNLGCYKKENWTFTTCIVDYIITAIMKNVSLVKLSKDFVKVIN